jgi:hypothetical protein
MNSQLSIERKQQPSSSFLSFRVNKQRAAVWFSKPSFFRFKSKSGFLSHSSSSSKSKSSLSSVPSLSRSRSPSTTTLKDSIYPSTTSVSNQPGVAIKKSSKARQTSIFEAPIAIQSTSRSIHHSTVPQPTPNYRQPILPNVFTTMIPMVPGVCCS